MLVAIIDITLRADRPDALPVGKPVPLLVIEVDVQLGVTDINLCHLASRPSMNRGEMTTRRRLETGCQTGRIGEFKQVSPVRQRPVKIAA